MKEIRVSLIILLSIGVVIFVLSQFSGFFSYQENKEVNSDLLHPPEFTEDYTQFTAPTEVREYLSFESIRIPITFNADLSANNESARANTPDGSQWIQVRERANESLVEPLAENEEASVLHIGHSHAPTEITSTERSFNTTKGDRCAFLARIGGNTVCESNLATAQALKDLNISHLRPFDSTKTQEVFYHLLEIRYLRGLEERQRFFIGSSVSGYLSEPINSVSRVLAFTPDNRMYTIEFSGIDPTLIPQLLNGIELVSE